MKPFRWNIAKKEQLGGLLEVPTQKAYPSYEDQLLECSAKIVARSSERKIVFVGRSPENIFDFLSGIFQETSRESKIDLLNISNRFREINEIKNTLPSAFQALKEHFFEVGISPDQIIAEPKGICFCDLVASGGTFKNIFYFLEEWAKQDGSDFPGITNKLGFIGITQRTKNSPNTWRWQQNAGWVKQHNKLTVKNVSVPASLWDYLGNRQVKVAKTNYPERWNTEEILLPPREEENIKALKQAFKIYNLGRNQRKIFSEKLASLQEFREPWIRSLVNELKQFT